jgi:hypothetical protein
MMFSLILLIAAAPFCFGQTTSNGTLRGDVKDQTGAVVPGATVTITSADRGYQRTAKTNDQGEYVIASVSPGMYSLKVEAKNFKTYEQTELAIAPSENRSNDVSLQAGPQTETVTVTGDQAPIKTDTGERSETITASQIQNLSILGRSSLELLRILPGVVSPNDPSDPAATDSVSFGGGTNANANYYVNGIRGVNNNVTIDGSRVMDIGSNNGTIITANNDMVQEVTVKSSNYAAEYGSAAVGIFATTKGGTNQFHGEVYDYIRPESFQASDASNRNVGASRPHTSFQYPGGNIGGPVIIPGTHFNENRDKLFFFGGFEVQRQKPDHGSRIGTVPTAAERAGDFSKSNSIFKNGAGNNVYCIPSNFGFSNCDGTANQVTNGNFSSFKDPLGTALLNFYPLPNFTPAAGSGLANRNYTSAVIAPENRTDLKLRFDYKVSNNTNVYVRLARETESDDSPYGIWWGPSNFELPSHVVGTNLGRSVAGNITTVLSPTMTNEVVVSWSKLHLDYDFSDPSKVTKEALGVANLQTPWGARAQTNYAPLALISWDVNAQLWEPGGLPLFAINDSYSVTDALSKVWNNHTLKFGGLIERATKQQNLNGTPEGQVEFENSQARTTGNAFANLYTGRINSFTQSTKIPNSHFKLYNYEFYAQDAFKIRPNVTLEYGARFSLYTNNTDQNGLATVFSPAAYIKSQGPYLNGSNGQPDLSQPNGFLQFKNGQVPKSVFSGNAGLLFAPRLNIAWDISGKGTTVIRGGAGVFYNRVQGNYQYAIQTLPPNSETVAPNAWGAPNNDLTLSNLGSFSPLGQAPGVNCRAAGNCPGGFVSQDLQSNQVPRVTTVSMSVAQKLPWQMVLEAAYVGTFGRHLPERTGINFITANLKSGTLGTGANAANLADPVQRAAVAQNAASLAMLLPYPAYSGNGGGIMMEDFIGTSNYHSMQVTVNRQLGRSLQFFMTYTFSKALGTTSTNESDGDQIIDPIDARGKSYGILNFDRTHIFNISYNYNIPDIARGSMKNGFTNAVLNGWQMSGITTLQSGRPIHFKFTGAAAGDTVLFSWFGNNGVAGGNSSGASGIAPLYFRDPQTHNSNLNGTFFDINAFGVPAFGSNGSAQSPFYVRGPNVNNFDVTFFKNFNFTESKKLQFRMGLFNVFNGSFANPDLGDIGGLAGSSVPINTVANFDPQYKGSVCYQIPIGTPNGIGTVPQNGTAILASTGATVNISGICDPTKGFHIDPNTVNNFGKIQNKHGHRRIEMALKFYF